MISIEKFNMSHLIGFEPISSFPNLEENMLSNIGDCNREVLSIIHEDNVICLAGANYYRAGTVEVWIIPSELINNCKLDFFKTINKMIIALQDNGFHRVEMAVREGWDKGYKWAEKLGFKFEGIMRAYDLDYNNHALFARVR